MAEAPPADGLAAQFAAGQAFMLGQVVIEPDVAGKRPVADRAVDGGVVFVFVAELVRGITWGGP